MTDTSAILASLNRFIERFARDDELMSGHRVATQCQPMAIVKPLISRSNNHSSHSGHPKQETLGADRERCDSCCAETSGSDLARKVSSVDGYSGKSGKTLSNQEVVGSHRGNADGHSGKSSSDQQFGSGWNGTRDQAGSKPPTPANAFRLDPTFWSGLYEERAAHRQFDGDYPRVEAELLAWRENRMALASRTPRAGFRPGMCRMRSAHSSGRGSRPDRRCPRPHERMQLPDRL